MRSTLFFFDSSQRASQTFLLDFVDLPLVVGEGVALVLFETFPDLEDLELAVMGDEDGAGVYVHQRDHMSKQYLVYERDEVPAY